MSRISDRDFNELVDLVYRECGIVLDNKRELVEARLASLARKRGYADHREILANLQRNPTGDALVELLDQVSTNLTYFYREPAHFDFLEKTILPEIKARKKLDRNPRIRFWSAACSSGEEAYSLAMTALNHLGADHSWDIKILGTDISTKVLRKALDGGYSRQDVAKIPSTDLQKYFDREGERLNPVYRVKDVLKQTVVFRRLNLLRESYPFSGLFDLIVCRNVMIYFDMPTKQSLLERFHKYLAPGGYLFTGHAESLTASEHMFHRIKVAVYKK